MAISYPIRTYGAGCRNGAERCTSSITRTDVRKVLTQMFSDELPEGAKVIFSKDAIFLYNLVVRCCCTIAGYHGTTLINPLVLRQAMNIICYAENKSFAFCVTEDPTFSTDSFVETGEYVAYNILHEYISCYFSYVFVVEEAALYLYGYNSQEFDAVKQYSNYLYMCDGLELPEAPKDILENVDIDQDWIICE